MISWLLPAWRVSSFRSCVCHKRSLLSVGRCGYRGSAFQADAPNRIWVSDVTCFKINQNYLYICVILDLFSRKVVAHRVSPKNSTYLITSTFRQAFQRRNAPQSLVFHSDQGVQYTSFISKSLIYQTFLPLRCNCKIGQPESKNQRS